MSIDEILNERDILKEELVEREKKIYALETAYLKDSLIFKNGNIEIEDVFSIADVSHLDFYVKESKRIFSKSSMTSPIRNFVAQAGKSIYEENQVDRFPEHLAEIRSRSFNMELKPKIKHICKGIASFVNNGVNNMHASQFLITLGDKLTSLDGKHTVFGVVTEGWDTIEKFNSIIADDEGIPFQDIRISHTIILEDPFNEKAPRQLECSSRSPSPDLALLKSRRLAAHENLDEFEGLSKAQIEHILEERDLKAGTQILEMVGDIPDAEMKPPENVLFVCKLNPATIEEDLEIIFARFGNILSCEIIRDYKTNESLQYGFIEFENVEDCEKAYFKMDNVLIDDRRIHVNFCQSIKPARWKTAKMSRRYRQFQSDKSYEREERRETPVASSSHTHNREKRPDSLRYDKKISHKHKSYDRRDHKHR